MHSLVSRAQADLRSRYKDIPELARTTSQAVTGGVPPDDPFHGLVRPGPQGSAPIAFGTHSAVGGPYDAPCPGDLMCAALAACMDSSIRLVANLLGVELLALEVRVQGSLDVRGALGIGKDVPVGFQAVSAHVRLKARDGTPPEQLAQLRTAVERCCVVARTLQTPPALETSFET
jgi:uncharacterized OsmC-like protein